MNHLLKFPPKSSGNKVRRHNPSHTAMFWQYSIKTISELHWKLCNFIACSFICFKYNFKFFVQKNDWVQGWEMVLFNWVVWNTGILSQKIYILLGFFNHKIIKEQWPLSILSLNFFSCIFYWGIQESICYKIMAYLCWNYSVRSWWNLDICFRSYL